MCFYYVDPWHDKFGVYDSDRDLKPIVLFKHVRKALFAADYLNKMEALTAIRPDPIQPPVRLLATHP